MVCLPTGAKLISWWIIVEIHISLKVYLSKEIDPGNKRTKPPFLPSTCPSYKTKNGCWFQQTRSLSRWFLNVIFCGYSSHIHNPYISDNCGEKILVVQFVSLVFCTNKVAIHNICSVPCWHFTGWSLINSSLMTYPFAHKPDFQVS